MTKEAIGSPTNPKEIQESNKDRLAVETVTQPEVDQPIDQINIVPTPPLSQML